MEFSEQKATQVAAFFLEQGGGSLQIKKLMKLMYLAERTSVEKYAELMIGDNPFSFAQGPLLSKSYDIAKPGSLSDVWNAHISRSGIDVVLQHSPKNSHLSRADFSILEEVWAKFGEMSPNELSDYTHDNCSEWTDPGSSSTPIEYWEFAQAIGYDEVAASSIDRRIIEQRKLSVSLRQQAAGVREA